MKDVLISDFVLEYGSIQKEIDNAIKRVLKSGCFVLGPEVEGFEKEFGKYIGTKFTVGVASGTDALTIAIKSLGFDRGDEVVVPANVYPTVFGVALSGVNVRLSDVNPKTLNIDVEQIERAVTKKTKAIVVVHLYGNPANMLPIMDYAKLHGLYVIEDCAQASGATYNRQKVGTFGDISCFSFYPTKNLGAYGDGGAILTSNKKFAEKVRLLRMYGEKSRYQSVSIGYNSRLDEVQAAILRVKLKHLDAWNAKRRHFSSLYKSLLSNLPLELTEEYPKGNPSHHLFVVRTKERDRIKEHLKLKKINTGVHYPIPIHKTLSFYMLDRPGGFPNSERASKTVLSLPMHPFLTDFEIDFVYRTLKEFFGM